MTAQPCSPIGDKPETRRENRSIVPPSRERFPRSGRMEMPAVPPSARRKDLASVTDQPASNDLSGSRNGSTAVLETAEGPVRFARLAWLAENGSPDPSRLPHTVK